MKPNVLVLLVALLAIAMPANALVGPDVRVVSTHFDGPLTSGSSANLTLELANFGVFTCAYKVTTQVQVAAPLSIDGLDSRIVEKFCTPDTVNVTFAVKVDPNAVAGSYPLSFTTSYESEFRASYAISNTVYARVDGSPVISAHVTKTNPVTVYPDDLFSVDVTVDNTGAYRADALTLSISAEQPIEVKPSTSVQSAATLLPRASVTKTFWMHVPKEAAAKAYSLSLSSRYIDENGKWTTSTIPLQVTVSRKALFEASDGQSVSFVDSRNNEFVFKLKNTGTDVARRVRAKLLPSFPFSTQGSVQFVDELAPGQETQLVFFADVDKEGTPGTYSLDVSVTWENPEGDQFSDTLPVGVKVEYTPLFQMVFVNLWYLWAVVAIVALFLLSRRMKGQKQK